MAPKKLYQARSRADLVRRPRWNTAFRRDANEIQEPRKKRDRLGVHESSLVARIVESRLKQALNYGKDHGG